MDIQTIRSPSGDEMVVLSREDYEDLVDARAANQAKAALASGEEELLSEGEVKVFLASKRPLAFWRDKRGLRQDELAQALGTSQGTISDIESGRRGGGVDFYRRAASKLRVPIEALLPPE